MDTYRVKYDPACIYYMTTKLPNFNMIGGYKNLEEFIQMSTDQHYFRGYNFFIENVDDINFTDWLEEPISVSKPLNYEDIINTYPMTDIILDRFIFNNNIDGLPQVFTIDTSFKESNQFIKVFVTKESIDMLFDFMMNIQKDYIALQERLYNNKNYGALFNRNLGEELSIIDQVMSHNYNAFIKPDECCNITLIHNDNNTYNGEGYYNTNHYNTLSFHKTLIKNFYDYNIDTYYICINCVGSY